MNNKEVMQKLLFLYDKECHVKEPLDMESFQRFLDDTKKVLVLDYIKPVYHDCEVESFLVRIKESLGRILSREKDLDIDNILSSFVNELPEARELLMGSARAIMEGDPAANSIQEVILCYPGFLAISHYRIANILYRLGLKFLARMVGEDAHRKTGIDINPGASIGKNFFIDHGTGIVIGETTIIGDDVKLYQGVTLGALSLKDGQKLKGTKRHPTVCDSCTIYSNASILGGETVIGEHSTIGANTYLISSVPPYSRVLLTKTGVTIESKKE